VQSEGGHDGDGGVGGPDPGCQEVGPSGIIWTNKQWKVGDLTEWSRNPRRLTDSQAKHLATSVIKFGYVEPIQVNKDGRIIGGHMRARVMLQAGLLTNDDWIDVRWPSRQLTDEEHEELAIRLNKNTGAWDFDKLTADFDQNDLRDWGFSPMDFGMVDKPPKADEPMKPTNLKPAEPKFCPHCGEQL
jgi:hypothetical protein